MVGYLLASDVDPMLLGQHWPNNQNVVQPTLFDDIGQRWVNFPMLAGLFGPTLKLLNKQSSEPVTAVKHESKTSNGKRKV